MFLQASNNVSMRCVARFGALCTILKKKKKTHEGLLILVKLHAEACNFTKSNASPLAFFTFFNCTNSTKSHNASRIRHCMTNHTHPHILLNRQNS